MFKYPPRFVYSFQYLPITIEVAWKIPSKLSCIHDVLYLLRQSKLCVQSLLHGKSLHNYIAFMMVYITSTSIKIACTISSKGFSILDVWYLLFICPCKPFIKDPTFVTCSHGNCCEVHIELGSCNSSLVYGIHYDQLAPHMWEMLLHLEPQSLSCGASKTCHKEKCNYYWTIQSNSIDSSCLVNGFICPILSLI